MMNRWEEEALIERIKALRAEREALRLPMTPQQQADRALRADQARRGR